MSSDLRDLFFIRPDVAYLNHGSFGAVPRPILEEYQRWQIEIEREPVDMIRRRGAELRRESRMVLGRWLNADGDDLVYVTTPTVCVNLIARSLDLKPGEMVISTDHEFGACERAWRKICEERGVVYEPVPLPLPVDSAEDIVDGIFARVTAATRVIFISHITSSTALILPVEEICRRAREAGIITVIDGAHAPGHIPVDLSAIGADFYIGVLHKWLCAPKGTAFLHAPKTMHASLRPLVYGWDVVPADGSASLLTAQLENVGTVEMSGMLSVPSAIAFQEQYDWNTVRRNCHEMLRAAREPVLRRLDAEPVAPDSPDWYMQMCSFLLPSEIDGFRVERLLRGDHNVEVGVVPWNGRHMFRISIQGYNSWNDIERLLQGIDAVMG